MKTMMIYGFVPFMKKTIPYQETSREISWRQETNAVIGKLPKTQFLGKDSETITITGTLMPEITGGALSIKPLEIMAEIGEPYPLIDGATFLILGFFVITSISVTSSVFFDNGAPMKIDFSMQLQRTDDSMFS